jgi:hypothetical protein
MNKGFFILKYLKRTKMKTLFLLSALLTSYLLTSQIINDFKVNDDEGPSYQIHADISVDGDGNFVICWSDLRNGVFDIFAQRFSVIGTPLDTNFKINDVDLQGSEGFPKIVSDSSGNFIATWGTDQNGGDVFAQRYSSEGIPLGINFRVNTDTGYSRQFDPSIAIDGAGNFVIAWYDTRNGNYDVYAQRYLNDGSPIAENFKVNEEGSYSYHDGPWVASDKNGNFLITWTDGRNGNHDVYAQRYLNDGNPDGPNFIVNNDKEGMQWASSVSSDVFGDFIVTWRDETNDSSSIYAQRYNSDGEEMGDNFKVNEENPDFGMMGRSYATVDSNGNFLIAWCGSYLNDIYNYAQCYSFDGTPIGYNLQITSSGEGVSPFIWNDRIYNTWMAFDDETGWDVWANVLNWPEMLGTYNSHIISFYQLCYPNPFTTSTTIEYTLNSPRSVTITFYNQFGKLVDRIEQKQSAGKQQVVWSPELPGGVYFFRLEAGEQIASGKVVLVR